MGISPRFATLMNEITRRYEQGDTDDALYEITNLCEEALQYLGGANSQIGDVLKKVRWVDRLMVDLIDHGDRSLSRGDLHTVHDKLSAAIDVLDEFGWSDPGADIEKLTHASKFLEERTESMYRELYNSPR